MKTKRIQITLIGVASVLALLWNLPASADTIGVYQPTVVREAQWALQRGYPDHAVALLANRGAQLRRWHAEAQGNGLLCQAWFQKGDYARAERACDLAVRAAGEADGQYLYNRAVMRLLLGRIDEAVADLKTVAAKNPQATVSNPDFTVAGR